MGRITPNQIFIGCEWKNTRPKYERAIAKLKRAFPLSFVIVGRDEDQKADDLLEKIKGKLKSSSFAVFDATYDNANVSLEFGIAEERGIPRAIYLSTHNATRKRSGESPIIADLAGKNQKRYKQESQLRGHLIQLSKGHAFTVKFENALRKYFRSDTKGGKRRNRALALKVIHQLDEKHRCNRAQISSDLQGDSSRYSEWEIDSVIRKLHLGRLLKVDQGRYSKVRLR